MVAYSKVTSDIQKKRGNQMAYQAALITLQQTTIQDLEIQVLDRDRHIFSMEQILARAGLAVPPRPESLSVKFKEKDKENG